MQSIEKNFRIEKLCLLIVSAEKMRMSSLTRLNSVERVVRQVGKSHVELAPVALIGQSRCMVCLCCPCFCANSSSSIYPVIYGVSLSVGNFRERKMPFIINSLPEII